LYDRVAVSDERVRLHPRDVSDRRVHFSLEDSPMPQSLANVLLHVIFSTKNRSALLSNRKSREGMHAYLAGALKNLDCPPVIVGGTTDHVHFLCHLSRTISMADVLEATKKSSSRWIKSCEYPVTNFAWQNGYGAFSVSQSNASRVCNYIANQEKHHRIRTFQEEYRAFLRCHQLAFDERYVWD
jgi:REP element-mobilizing transposase RayT